MHGVIQVFPTWPEKWDAQFELLVPGAFLVSSSRQHGEIAFVAIKAQVAATCKLANPWNAPATIRGERTPGSRVEGSLIEILMKAGETVVLTKAGAPAPAFPLHPTLQPVSFPLKLNVTGPDGKIYAGRLGN